MSKNQAIYGMWAENSDDEVTKLIALIWSIDAGYIKYRDASDIRPAG
jgi:hypothetical protein